VREGVAGLAVDDHLLVEVDAGLVEDVLHHLGREEVLPVGVAQDLAGVADVHGAGDVAGGVVLGAADVPDDRAALHGLGDKGAIDDVGGLDGLRPSEQQRAGDQR
jgi:hypothetical protein